MRRCCHINTVFVARQKENINYEEMKNQKLDRRNGLSVKLQ